MRSYLFGLITVVALTACKSGPTPVATTTPPAADPAATAPAQTPDWSPGPPRHVATVEGITEYRLDNGMRVLLFPDNSKDKFTVAVTYFVGSRHEGYGEAGMAHLLEHMVFKGSTNFPGLSTELENRGAAINGTTGTDRTNYFETMTATWDNLEYAIRMEADRMVNSFIKDEDLQSEFSVVRNEFEMGENSASGVLRERVQAMAFGWHNYGKSVIGNRSDIERVPVDALRAFYRKYYRPDNAMLVVSGKFDVDKTLALINESFGAIPKPQEAIPATYTVEPVQDGSRRVELRRVGDIAWVALTYHTVAGADERWVAVDALSSVLTDEPSGRLYKGLVETGMATSVNGGADLSKDPGALTLFAKVAPGQDPEKVARRMIELTEGLGEAKVTDEEVARYRVQSKKGFKLFFAESQSVALILSEFAALGDWRMLFVFRDRTEAVTTAQVQSAADSFLKQSNRTLGLFIPTETPDRAPMPTEPDVVALTKDYEGRAGISEGEAFEATVANIESRTTRVVLDGGMKLTLLPKQTRGDAVQARLAFRYGDLKSLRGAGVAAELLPEMLARGAAGMSFQQIKDRFDELEAQVSFSGKAGVITVSITTTHDNLGPVLKLVGKIMSEPSFPSAEFELLKKERLAALEGQKSDPQARVMTALGRLLRPYPKTDARYTPTIEENIELTNKTKLANVSRLYKRFVGASYSQLTVVGDFDADEVRLIATEQFNGWKSPKKWVRMPQEYFEVPAGEQTIDTPDKEMAILIVAQTLPMRADHADYPALTLFNYVFGGGGFSSRLMKRLREKDGLSYAAFSFVQAGELDESAVLGAGGIMAPQNAGKALAALLEELNLMLSEEIPDDEFKKAKEAYVTDFTRNLSDDEYVLGALHEATFLGRTLEYLDARNAKIAALTPAQVLAAAARHVSAGRLVKLTAGDQKKAQEKAGK